MYFTYICFKMKKKTIKHISVESYHVKSSWSLYFIKLVIIRWCNCYLILERKKSYDVLDHMIRDEYINLYD